MNKAKIHKQQKKREKARRKRQQAKKEYQQRRNTRATYETRLGKAKAWAAKANRRLPQDAYEFIVSSKTGFRKFIASCKRDHQRTVAAKVNSVKAAA